MFNSKHIIFLSLGLSELSEYWKIIKFQNCVDLSLSSSYVQSQVMLPNAIRLQVQIEKKGKK